MKLVSHFDRPKVPSTLGGHVRKATRFEYKCWLAGYLRRGGDVDHRRDRDFESGNYFFATSDFRLPKLCGANAFGVIVPQGIKVDSKFCGHCRVLRMDGFTTNRTVEMFNDIELFYDSPSKM